MSSPIRPLFPAFPDPRKKRGLLDAGAVALPDQTNRSTAMGGDEGILQAGGEIAKSVGRAGAQIAPSIWNAVKADPVGSARSVAKFAGEELASPMGAIKRAPENIRQGNWGELGLDALAALPLVGAIGKGVSGGGKFLAAHGDDYLTAAQRFAKEKPLEAGFVTIAPPAEGERVFLTAQGKAGFKLAPNEDGTFDIRGLFNHGTKGDGTVGLVEAVRAGGATLDNYDTPLSRIYDAAGFKTTERFPFDASQSTLDPSFGAPDYTMRRLDPEYAAAIKDPSKTAEQVAAEINAARKQGLDILGRPLAEVTGTASTMPTAPSPRHVGRGLLPTPVDPELAQAQAIRRVRGSQNVEAAQAPKSGVSSKGEEGVAKDSPLPPTAEVKARLDAQEAAIRYQEQNRLPPWEPESRGVFDRSGFDPDFRMQDGTWDLTDPTGKPSPVLEEILSNPRLRDHTKRQINLGLDQGGRGFYNTAPIKGLLTENLPDGERRFEDLMGASSAGSIQSSLPQEFHNASVLLFAKENGLTIEEARKLFAQMHPDWQAPWVSRGHEQKFNEFLTTGTINPAGPASGSRKVPSYHRSNMGQAVESGSDAAQRGNPLTEPVIDTHEQKSSLWSVGGERYTNKLTGAEYGQVGGLLHQPLAKEMGIRVDQAQAGRWFGGGPLTGLASPRGDRMQGMEDMLVYSAHKLGISPTPANLKQMMLDVAQGKLMLPPYYGKGNPAKGLL